MSFCLLEYVLEYIRTVRTHALLVLVLIVLEY